MGGYGDKYVQFNGHVIAIKTYQADIIIKIMFVKLLNVETHYTLRITILYMHFQEMDV